MGFFYFDESIQERGGFIIGAIVYSDTDLTPAVFKALSAVGLIPRTDEFKSGSRMSSQPRQSKVRDLLSDLLQSVKTGLVVVPSAHRDRLGHEALVGLSKILRANFSV